MIPRAHASDVQLLYLRTERMLWSNDGRSRALGAPGSPGSYAIELQLPSRQILWGILARTDVASSGPNLVVMAVARDGRDLARVEGDTHARACFLTCNFF